LINLSWLARAALLLFYPKQIFQQFHSRNSFGEYFRVRRDISFVSLGKVKEFKKLALSGKWLSGFVTKAASSVLAVWGWHNGKIKKID
jgi:hypothetical protein